MPASFNVLSDIPINGKSRFLRIEPTSLSVTLKEIFESLMDISWLEQFRGTPLYGSFLARVNPTLETIESDFQNGSITAVDSDAGEKVVSELARQAVVFHLGYLDIPLSELFKEQKGQNPGFDFLSMNNNQVLLFGEAKYQSGEYAYRASHDQIKGFIEKNKDTKDIANFVYFIPYETNHQPYANYENGVKGYMAAFSAKTKTDQELIDNIQALDSFVFLQQFEEVICIAVNV